MQRGPRYSRMMFRTLAAVAALGWGFGRGAVAPGAQTPAPWNADRTRELVERAVTRRQQQLADTGLADYRATAHGYITFLAQVGHGLIEAPKIVKADELALEVYWRAPNFSKQVIVGRRDTLLLPTDISYHRDHLGIVQNNFPDVIRIGEGDEVRDVPHPLSRTGLPLYDFAVRDSLRIRTPQRTIDVLELRVRPKDDGLPRIIGSLFLERETAQVVRMAFNFTRAAFLEKELEDIAVVLENSLVEGRYWLPSRQEIEIRRTGSWLDFPARGIIRGRWEIGGYALNVSTAAPFYGGPEIVQYPDIQLRRHLFPGRILDSLPPDIRAVADADVRRVQDEARALVRGQAIARARATTVSAARVSDFVRVDRVEGLSLGAGISHAFGSGRSLSIAGRWGVADHQAKGRLTLSDSRPSTSGASLFASRDFREVGLEAEASSVVNSIAAQEFGSDRSDPFDVRAVGIGLTRADVVGARARFEAAYESHGALEVHATPVNGAFRPTIAALPLQGVRVVGALERPPTLSWFDSEVAMTARLALLHFRRAGVGGAATVGRASLAVDAQRPYGVNRLVARLASDGTSNSDLVPPQELVYVGGPMSGPGYELHSLVGRVGATAHIEWQTPMPFFPIALGRFGTAPRRGTFAPFAHVAAITGTAPGAPVAGAYPSAGIGVLSVFDLLRIDVARGFRGGRWSLAVDIVHDFWSAL
ncbi:MAG: hypothetical protein NVS4B3_14850 [Gemmatimonadaceae bacterium]